MFFKKASNKAAVKMVRSVCEAIEAPRVPGRVRIIAWGKNERTDGLIQIIDTESAQRVVQELDARGIDIVIDWEHMSEGGQFAAPDGLAPAAGWMRKGTFEIVDGDGIYAKVDWTPRAARAIANNEYRYLSPVVLVDELTRMVCVLDKVALTNTPAIKGSLALVNKKLPNAVGDKSMEELLSFLRERLGLEPTAQPDEILAKLRQSADMLTTNSSRHLMTEQDRLNKENLELRNLLVNSQADGLLNAHPGKVPGSRVEWFRDYYRREPGAAKSWIENTQQLVATESVRIGSYENAAVRHGPGQRGAVINSARSGFVEAKTTARVVCSERAWINEKLMGDGEAPLSQDEINRLGIAC